MSEGSSAFSRRTVFLLIAAGGLAALASAILSVFGDGLGRRTVQASTFSQSAIGYGSLAELLQAQGFPVVVSTNETRRKVGRDTLLVLAEPIEGAQTDALLDDLMGAPNVLLILPKWRAQVGRKPTDRVFLEAFYAALRGHLEQKMLFGERRADKYHRTHGNNDKTNA